MTLLGDGDAARWFDISVPIRGGMTVFPGDPQVALERVAAIGRGDAANLSRLTLGVHTGTHVDAPAHFIEGGAGVDVIPLASLIGPAQVVDATQLSGAIGAEDLSRLPISPESQRVILKTRNSSLWHRAEFAGDYVGLTEAAAKWLVDRGTVLVGIDYLSIAPHDVPAPTHITLLAGSVVIVEGLDLEAVPAGAYTLVCLPIRIEGADGAPARAVLIPSGG